MMTLEKKLERVQKFNFDGSPIRTVMIKGEPWFVAADVCEILAIENVSDALSRIKSVNIGSTDVENSRGRLRKTKIVNESGLYRLIFQSRKPEAEKFTELRIAEGGEGRGPALHGRDEALLAHDGIRYVAEPGFADEVQTPLRLAPHRVERIVRGNGSLNSGKTSSMLPKLNYSI